QGATSTLAVSGLTTNAGGTLNMQNGSTTNVVNANGGFNGTGNNTVAVHIALNATQHQSRQLKATGASHGPTSINFPPVGWVGNLSFFATPIRVITSTGGGNLNATAVNLPASNNGGAGGLVNYSLQQTAPGNYSVFATLNTGAISSTLGGILGSLSSMDAAFH